MTDTFFEVRNRETSKTVEVFPLFNVGSSDISTKGGGLEAFWNYKTEAWSSDVHELVTFVDEHIRDEAERIRNFTLKPVVPLFMRDWNNHMFYEFKNYVKNRPDSSVLFDNHVVFKTQRVSKEDYALHRLDYDLDKKEPGCYNRLISRLYEPTERAKLEWAIGSIFVGESKQLQKFIALYGEGGSGKSTVLNIIEALFGPYCTNLDTRAIVAKSSSGFVLEPIESNPLVIVNHEANLSKINDNSILNALVSHETLTINSKYKSLQHMRSRAFLFIATNEPIQITDSRSGLIRRLISVTPTGDKFTKPEYDKLMTGVMSELGSIANRCINVFKSMGANYYTGYRETSMMEKTDVFYNFVLENYIQFKEEGVSLKKAYMMYREYCSDSNITFVLPKFRFKEELKTYFRNVKDDVVVNGERFRNYFQDLKEDLFISKPTKPKLFSETVSWFEEQFKDLPAQYASESGKPTLPWSQVTTTLKDLDTTKLHYVLMPETEYVVVDFDLKDETGEKNLEKNLIAAKAWPETYAEVSQSGKGIHKHYFYSGDVDELADQYADGIEIKRFKGNASLRRKFTVCNGQKVETLDKILPKKKEEKHVVNMKNAANEKQIRNTILKALRKEVFPNTKPSVDFIAKVLDDAYNSSVSYDVSDLKSKVTYFAGCSTNNATYCLKLVSKMKFSNILDSEPYSSEEDVITFFDVEVFPNLFLVSYKELGVEECHTMINPSPEDIGVFLTKKLVGFNNRRYDNHILYARYQGYTIEDLYNLSRKLIKESRGYFSEAYRLSYTDIYDFSSKKQSLKKFEIELGISHLELGLPWDKPVPEEKWPSVAEYCKNDVLATEAVWVDRADDFVVREILADLSGLTPNDTNRVLIGKILFGNEKHPQQYFNYTDLRTIFPKYEFKDGVSYYDGEIVGEGGYVYAEPGMYWDVVTNDVASMHPSSIIALNLFGPYTTIYKMVYNLRIECKHGNVESVKNAFDGKLVKYLDQGVSLKKLANALKLILNSVYGYTAASFDNPFRDPRNVDNIVAKRGALFMCMLKNEIQAMGERVIHIKTDSIKVHNNPELLEYITKRGLDYDYKFEIEDEFDRLCLTNQAVYIGRTKDGIWEPKGDMFLNPYVFKTLFTHEPVTLDDKCEVKSVTGDSAIFVDYNADLPEGEHNYVFVGRVGRFIPVVGKNGGDLVRSYSDGRYAFVAGSKGYKWVEFELVKETPELEEEIDESYFNELVLKAREAISSFGDIDKFLNTVK